MSIPSQDAIRPVLLRALAELGGQARPHDVYPRVTEAFPDLTPEDLGRRLADGRTNQWTNRIQWARQDLVNLGLIDGRDRGVWRLTPEGSRLAAEKPDRVDRLPSPRRRRSSGEDADADRRPGPAERPAQLRTGVAGLIAELREAAADSRGPERLEQALTKAFSHLGFEAQRFGGAGRTDVLVNAPLGLHRYRVVVDAKSTNRPRVSDAQVDWLSIRGHREQERADYAAVVGPEFAAGNLTQRAREFDVAILTIEDLVQVLDLHTAAPLTLVELRPLFDGSKDVRTTLSALRAAAGERARRMLLPRRLLTFIDNFNRAQPDMVLAKPETLLALVINDKELLGTTLDDVRRALALLETLGVLSSQNGDGYVSQTSLGGADAFLGMIGRAAVTSSAAVPGEAIREQRNPPGLSS